MLIDRLVGLAIDFPGRMLIFWLLWLCLFATGLSWLRIDTSTSRFLDQSDPAWMVYQRSLDRFGGDEFVTVALRTAKPFDEKLLRDLAALSGSLGAISGVRRVDSLATVNLIRRDLSGSIRLDPALAGELPQTASEWEDLRSDISKGVAPALGLLSDDGRVVALNILLDENIQGDRSAVMGEIESRLTGRDWLVSGVPVFRTAVNEQTRSEVLWFAPATVAVIALVFALALRSVVSVALPLAIGGIGSVSALGAMGFLGIALSLSTMILPSVLLALGCAYGMHVVVAARRTTLRVGLAVVSRPVALSGLTTAIGFLAMATVPIDAIRELATYGALGVVVLTAASLSFGPAVLARLSLGARPGDAEFHLGLAHWWVPLVGPALRAPRLTIAAWLAVAFATVWGLGQLTISTDIILWFAESSEIRRDYEEIRQDLSGITPVNVVVTAQADRRVTEPILLAAVSRLSDELEELEVVGRVVSIAAPLKRIHEVLGQDSSGELPDRLELAEQYLLMLEGSDYLDGLISLDRLATNLWLRVDNNSSDEIVELKSWVDEWWRRSGVEGYSADTTGVMYEFARAEEAIAYGQIRGLSFAFLAVATILLALLRDVRLAVISLIPNALPLAIGFGLMGFAGVPLDAATVCLGSLALGIAVDDTVHLVFRYREHAREGKDVPRAIADAFDDVFPALALSTASIAAGFLLLGASEFTLVRHLGIVTAGLVVLCLAADASLLPALLLRFQRRRGDREHAQVGIPRGR